MAGIRIATVFGTRPEIIKMSLLIPMLDGAADHSFVFTSQHYSRNMAEIFFDELGVRKPDCMLEVNSSDYGKLQGAIEKSFERINPTHVVVYGDTNSTLAGALAARKVRAELVHVEAGLRSFDSRMPEEYNRTETDKLSSLLLTPTDLTSSFIAREGLEGRVSIVGNTIVDACLHYVKKTDELAVLEKYGLEKNDYVLVTAHRQENVDRPENVVRILKAFGDIGKTVLFPIHPRTKKNIKGKSYNIPKNVRIVDPIGYLDFLPLLKNSSLVLTDSGGVQEEAITLKVPCLTLRYSTERWETIHAGGNFLVGLEPELVSYCARMIFDSDLGEKMRRAKNPYGNGKASEKCMREIKAEIE
ncbi:MAG: UDP-N-acetylglucosamine 2-epimerase (non-hydrolyzing) [Candidatus Micrarchaeota archaeon]